MEYDRGDNFPFNFESKGIQFGSKLLIIICLLHMSEWHSSARTIIRLARASYDQLSVRIQTIMH